MSSQDGEPCSRLWRSEDMSLVSITFQREGLKKDLLELGRMGCLELCDMNANKNSFAREFSKDVRSSETVQRTLRSFKLLLTKWHTVLPKVTSSPDAYKEGTLEETEEEVKNVARELDKLSENLESLESQWLRSYSVWQTMESDALRGASRSTGVEGGLGVIAGTICSSKVLQFRRLAHRATRGYATLSLSEWQYPGGEFYPVASAFKKDDLSRHVFVSVFGAGNAGIRLRKLAESMDV